MNLYRDNPRPHIVHTVRKASEDETDQQKVDETKKAHVQNSENKAMVIIFDYKGMMYTHTVIRGTTLTTAYYQDVLGQLLKVHISQKRRELVGKWKLHRDKAKPQVAYTVTYLLTKKGDSTVSQPL